jgi:hypothetical protein
MARMTDTERAAGKRAFHVFYRRNGKLYMDHMWAKTAEAASAAMLGFAHQMRWKIEIVRVDPVAPDA